VVVTDWRPYWDGYWAWGPRGYFWVSYEPWGWAPYRYGRWAWYGGRWCWIPGSAFAGAWVSWSWGTAWVGWAPLGYWGGPVYVGGPVYHGWYHPHCWTFVPPHHVVHHHVRRVAVPVNRVGSEVRRNAVVVRAPDVSPRRIATSVEAREAAARAASTDRVARLKTLAGEPRDELRPREIDRRLVTRNEAAARGDRGATAARPERSAPRATEGFSRRFVRGAPGDDRTAGQTPSASRKRSGTEVPSSPPVSSFPRRIVKDPRRGDESSPPSTSRVQPRQPQGESRVRDLYDRMSGPRQPRSVSPDKPSARSTRPDSQGPRAAPAQPAPSRKPTATPARPSPPRAPKAAPERGTPQESRGSGRRKGGSKKDGEKKR
jgi:hypothetical protein